MALPTQLVGCPTAEAQEVLQHAIDEGHLDSLRKQVGSLINHGMTFKACAICPSYQHLKIQVACKDSPCDIMMLKLTMMNSQAIELLKRDVSGCLASICLVQSPAQPFSRIAAAQ
jgi:hypothetical protein